MTEDEVRGIFSSKHDVALLHALYNHKRILFPEDFKTYQETREYSICDDEGDRAFATMEGRAGKLLKGHEWPCKAYAKSIVKFIEFGLIVVQDRTYCITPAGEEYLKDIEKRMHDVCDNFKSTLLPASYQGRYCFRFTVVEDKCIYVLLSDSYSSSGQEFKDETYRTQDWFYANLLQYYALQYPEQFWIMTHDKLSKVVLANFIKLACKDKHDIEKNLTKHAIYKLIAFGKEGLLKQSVKGLLTKEILTGCDQSEGIRRFLQKVEGK